ncbi:MAG: amidohydrolase family protein [Planctomycetota bacterium]|jgi:hypothetical protein
MNTHKRLVAAGCVLLLLLGASAAQAQQTIVLRADRVLDLDRGKIVRDAVVVIEGDRIKSVGSRDVPADAQQIDLPGMTLLPGLIDMHTHLSSWRATGTTTPSRRPRRISRSRARATPGGRCWRGSRRCATSVRATSSTWR